MTTGIGKTWTRDEQGPNDDVGNRHADEAWQDNVCNNSLVDSHDDNLGDGNNDGSVNDLRLLWY